MNGRNKVKVFRVLITILLSVKLLIFIFAFTRLFIIDRFPLYGCSDDSAVYGSIIHLPPWDEVSLINRANGLFLVRRYNQWVKET